MFSWLFDSQRTRKSTCVVHSIKANQVQQGLVNSSVVNWRLKFVHLNRRLQEAHPFRTKRIFKGFWRTMENIIGDGTWNCFLMGNVRTTKLLAIKSLLGYCHGDKQCDGTETEKAAFRKVRGNNLWNVGSSLFKIQCSSIKLLEPSTSNSTWH